LTTKCSADIGNNIHYPYQVIFGLAEFFLLTSATNCQEAIIVELELSEHAQ